MLHEMKLIPAYEVGGWTSEDVAKGLQAYLICIEMFVAAVLHIFVFPHTDYLKPMVISRPNEGMRNFKGRRVGRKYNNMNMNRRSQGGFKEDRSYCSKTSDSPSMYDLEPAIKPSLRKSLNHGNRMKPLKLTDSSSKEDESPLTLQEKQQRKGFVHALIDSTLPRDVMDNTVGIARGDFTVERKTLLYHATASDQYSLFAKRRKATSKKSSDTSIDGDVEDS